MFNKKLKQQLAEAKTSSDFWAKKFHENEHLLEVATDKADFFRTRTEQLSDETYYIRIHKNDYNKLVNEKAILKNEYQTLKEENERLKQNVVNYIINLDASAINVHELTKKVIENINKGRY